MVKLLGRSQLRRRTNLNSKTFEEATGNHSVISPKNCVIDEELILHISVLCLSDLHVLLSFNVYSSTNKQSRLRKSCFLVFLFGASKSRNLYNAYVHTYALKDLIAVCVCVGG